MIRKIAIVGLAVALVLSTLGISGAVAAQPAPIQEQGTDTETEQTTDEEENEDIPVGHQLSGFIAMQSEALDGELDKRAFENRVDNAESDTEKSDEIGKEVEKTKEEMKEINEKRAELREQRKAGEISQVEFRVKMAELDQRATNAEKKVEAVEEKTKGLPVEKLEANGVNADAILELRSSASELSGPQVSEIAKSIAGNQEKKPDKGGPPEWVEEKKAQDEGDEENTEEGSEEESSEETTEETPEEGSTPDNPGQNGAE